MLDVPPKEPAWQSWLYVGIASLVIFITVPFARTIQSFAAEHAGPLFFLYFVAALFLISAFFAVRILKRRQVRAVAWLWLLAVAATYLAYAYILRRNAIEVIHLVEYGVLSLLVYRALVHRVRDPSVYAIAVAVAGIVGITDEWIQWIAPSRFWDLRDLQINLSAAALAQLGIAAGLRPRLISGKPSASGLSRLCIITAIGVFMLGLSYANTPQRIAAYATRMPVLSFLMNNKSMMVEYGYRYEDPNIGVFRSRFTLIELEQNDRNRGPELAIAFDKYINDEMFGEFQDIYSVPRDAYIHEAGIHLFRRNRYLNVARSEEVRRFLHYNIALRENRILEKYFPTGLRRSSHAWADEIRDEVDALADRQIAYESRVSRDIITRVSERQVLTGFTVTILALLLLAAYFRRRSSLTGQSSARNEGDRA